MLPFYAERLGTVEINASFYRMPTPRTVAGWAAATPPHFAFALKAPQRITHFGRLAGVEDAVRFFAETACGLGSQARSAAVPASAVLPQGHRTAGRGARRSCRSGLRVAFEFRHPSWFADDVYAALSARDVALCIVDAEDGTTADVATASWGYVRLRDRAYPEPELAAWAASLARPAWREAFAYFKHEDSGLGPALAAQLVAMVSARPRDLARGLVVAQAEKRRVAQAVVGRPFREADLRDQAGLEPGRAGQSPEVGKGRGGADEGIEAAAQIGQGRVGEARAHAPRVAQPRRPRRRRRAGRQNGRASPRAA